jgi:hypothetical protein
MRRRREVIQALGATALTTNLAMVVSAGEGEGRVEESDDRPDIGIINNSEREIQATLSLGSGESIVRNIPFQLPSKASQEIEKVELPKEDVYTIRASIGNDRSGKTYADAPNGRFPPYLSCHVDIRQDDVIVTTSEV